MTFELPKLSDEALSETLGAGAAPVPESETVCGEPVALSATLRVAVREPVAVGVKITDMVQLEPVARLVPQVLVWL